MKSAVIIFPGSNCDYDMYHALSLLGHQVEFVWHKTTDLSDFHLVVLPGGFSYGDYLRAGAIARFSNIMQAVVNFAKTGKPVIGICNGFQILTEAGLLPGVLLKNENLRFICRNVYLNAENTDTLFTNTISGNSPLSMPIAHGEGRFYMEAEAVKKLNHANQVVFRYVNGQNQAVAEANPNGSVENIAGIINKKGNVLGMMPHPERAVEALLGSRDGRGIFESLTA